MGHLWPSDPGSCAGRARRLWLVFAACFFSAIAARTCAPLAAPPAAAAAGDVRPSIAVCAVVRDDPDHVLEWVEHHLWLGVERVYLFDDGSPTPLDRVLRRFVEAGSVAVEAVPANASRAASAFEATPQGLAYNACIARFCGRHDYMAFLDADEFVMVNASGAPSAGSLRPSARAGGGGRARPGRRWWWRSSADATARHARLHHSRPPPPVDLPTLLGRTFDPTTTAAVLLTWTVFAGGHATKPAGGTLANYVACLPVAHPKSRVVKTVASCAFVAGAANPHTMVYRDGGVEVDERGVPLGHDGTYADRGPAPQRRLFLHHYMFRSADEAAAKLVAGSGSGWRKSEAYYREVVGAATERCEFAAARV